MVAPMVAPWSPLMVAPMVAPWSPLMVYLPMLVPKMGFHTTLPDILAASRVAGEEFLLALAGHVLHLGLFNEIGATTGRPFALTSFPRYLSIYLIVFHSSVL